MKILFQGDSITDCLRDRSDYHNLSGYTEIVAEKFKKDNIEFINLGISGDRTVNLLERYETDFNQIQPDVITLLIGVNDLWNRFNANKYTSPEQFEKNYRELLERIKKDIPQAKIILMEPFILPVEDKIHFRLDLHPLIDIVRKLSYEYANRFIPLDGIFAALCMKYNPIDLAGDGIHPTPLGNNVIAEYLTKEIKDLI